MKRDEVVFQWIEKERQRQLKGIDKEAVLAHCREQAAGLWQRINEGR